MYDENHTLYTILNVQLIRSQHSYIILSILQIYELSLLKYKYVLIVFNIQQLTKHISYNVRTVLIVKYSIILS